MKNSILNIAFIASALLINSCITPFEPEGVTSIDNMVVIEGDIVLNETTTVTISRSQALKDESKINYIKSAQVWVENENGVKYSGRETMTNGITQYLVSTSGLDATHKYKLCVKLQGGQKYESELLQVLIAPPIDSIGFNTTAQNESATFYVNTHDPTNRTNYYKWKYKEDWEFHSQYISLFEYDPVKNIVNSIPFEKNRYYCWGTASSSAILIATTTHLEQDIVYQKPLVSMGSADNRISLLYCLEVTQMAISHQAYIYWENIRKNSDKIGGIFSPQPSEIGGNIHCITSPSERVLGYVSAGVVSKKRKFTEGKTIGVYREPMSCESIFVDKDNPIQFSSLYEAGYDVISFSGSKEEGEESYWVMKKCSDCRIRGTKNKPSFWPNEHL